MRKEAVFRSKLTFLRRSLSSCAVVYSRSLTIDPSAPFSAAPAPFKRTRRLLILDDEDDEGTAEADEKGESDGSPQQLDVDALLEGVDFDEDMILSDDERPRYSDLASSVRATTKWTNDMVLSLMYTCPQVGASRSNAPASCAIAPLVELDPAHLPDQRDECAPSPSEVEETLRRSFSLTNFRPSQREAIDATLAGEDVLTLLPTGGGKSLCFQLPAVLDAQKNRGVTIVVSPLLSLIADQTRALIAKGVSARAPGLQAWEGCVCSAC